MSITVKNGNLRSSARKVRLVCDLVRMKPVSEALGILRFNEKREISLSLTKLINSALAIAVNQKKVDIDNLVVSSLYADEGRTMKRIQPRAQGRAYRVRHRTCKITLALSEK